MATVAEKLNIANWFDEYRIMVNPVILGQGTPLFKEIKDRLNLKLLRTQTFRNGNVLLCYEPAGKEK